MTAFRDVPIRRKLTASLLLASGTAIGLMSVAYLAHDFINLRSITLRQVSTLGKLVAVNSTAALAFDNADDAAETLAALADSPRVQAAALYDNRGQLFAAYPAGVANAALPAAPGADGYVFDARHVTGFEPVAQKSRRLGTLYLEYDTSAVIRDWLRDAIEATAVVAALVFAAAYVISKLVGNRISGPIQRLAETAQSVSARHDYSVRAVKEGRDEIGSLTDSFNDMLAEIQKLNQTLEDRVLRRTAQLEAANRELEAFSYSISHDLRAPLRHIDGYAGMLRKHAEAALDDKGRRFLGTISDSARRMGQLIDDLLAFSRISRSHLSICEVDQDALVAAVIRDQHVEGDDRPAVEWAVGPLPRVRADPAMLRQVWANLIGNAVKYSGKNPHPRVEITCAATPSEHVFAVRDNGVGFDMAYVGKLFGVFQRLHKASEFEGTGIGLANVQRIVARHGGRVWAEGRLGEGAVFHFSLPRQPASFP